MVMRTVLDGHIVLLLLVRVFLLFGIGVEPDDLGLRRGHLIMFDIHAHIAKAGFRDLPASTIKASIRYTAMSLLVV